MKGPGSTVKGTVVGTGVPYVSVLALSRTAMHFKLIWPNSINKFNHSSALWSLANSTMPLMNQASTSASWKPRRAACHA